MIRRQAFQHHNNMLQQSRGLDSRMFHPYLPASSEWFPSQPLFPKNGEESGMGWPEVNSTSLSWDLGIWFHIREVGFIGERHTALFPHSRNLQQTRRVLRTPGKWGFFVAYTSADVIAEHLRWLQNGGGEGVPLGRLPQGCSLQVGAPSQGGRVEGPFRELSDVVLLGSWLGIDESRWTCPSIMGRIWEISS